MSFIGICGLVFMGLACYELLTCVDVMQPKAHYKYTDTSLLYFFIKEN